jgi:hypothetical protein
MNEWRLMHLSTQLLAQNCGMSFIVFYITNVKSCHYTIALLCKNSSEHPFASNSSALRQTIKQLWFSSYSRAGGQADTSAFEHCFVGEVKLFIDIITIRLQMKHGEVIGMHSWLRFYFLERNQTERFDYKGFLVKRFVSIFL